MPWPCYLAVIIVGQYWAPVEVLLLGTLIMASGFGVWLWRTTPGRPFLERFLVAGLPAMMVFIGGNLGTRICQDTFWWLTDGRLTATLALARGINPYPLPGDGPILVSMYPPVAALTFLPAFFFKPPTAVFLAAGWIAGLCFFVPACWLHLRSTPEKEPVAVRLIALGVFLLLVGLSPSLIYSACAVTPDAPALGLALLSLGLLQKTSDDHPALWSGRRLGCIACFACLSVWSKQTLAPLLVALPIYMFLAYGWRACERLVFWLVLLGGITTLLMVWLFGPAQNLLFHLVIAPSMVRKRLDVIGGWNGIIHDLSSAFALSLILFVGGLGWKIRSRRLRTAHGVPTPWLDPAAQPWLLPIVSMGCLMPTTLLGYTKLGGAENTLSPSLVMLTLSATLVIRQSLARAWRTSRGAACPAEWQPQAGVLLLLALTIGATVPSVYDRVLTMRSIEHNHGQQVFNYVQRHPGLAYFPHHVVAASLAEGGLLPTETAVAERHNADLSYDPRHLGTQIPPNIQYLIYVPGDFFLGHGPSMHTFLPQFQRKIILPEHPDWLIYTCEDNRLATPIAPAPPPVRNKTGGGA